MRELAVLTFVTLDGVMQAPSMPEEDQSGGFTQGGWAAPYWQGVMAQVQREAMADPYDIVFGRRTYDIFAGHWPNAPESALSSMMNAARKYVATSDPHGLSWSNSVPVTGDIGDGFRRLKRQDGPRLQVHGSAKLIQALLAHDLIDEFRLWVFPVTVGQGKRLFEAGCPSMDLTLCKSGDCANGVAMRIYRRNRPPGR
ncbi:MAG: dihydrofolate reductase family protein [Pseudomonadota bacterium]